MRLIDADRLIEKMKRWREAVEKEYTCHDSYVQGYGDALDTVINAPTVETQETKHGKWLICMKTGRLECDACGHQTGEILGRQVTDFPEEELTHAEIFAAQEKAKCGKYYEVKAPNYCANCGAKMELGDNKKDELEI